MRPEAPQSHLARNVYDAAVLDNLRRPRVARQHPRDRSRCSGDHGSASLRVLDQVPAQTFMRRCCAVLVRAASVAALCVPAPQAHTPALVACAGAAAAAGGLRSRAQSQRQTPARQLAMVEGASETARLGQLWRGA